LTGERTKANQEAGTPGNRRDASLRVARGCAGGGAINAKRAPMRENRYPVLTATGVWKTVRREGCRNYMTIEFHPDAARRFDELGSDVRRRVVECGAVGIFQNHFRRIEILNGVPAELRNALQSAVNSLYCWAVTRLTPTRNGLSFSRGSAALRRGKFCACCLPIGTGLAET
jgi:hypothetical protein